VLAGNDGDALARLVGLLEQRNTLLDRELPVRLRQGRAGLPSFRWSWTLRF
jgi:hypothetical protein